MVFILKLKNFKCFESKEFRFNEGEMCLLDSPSGSGKTSIFQAIQFVMYNDPKDGLISFGKTGCSVELEYVFESESWKITRTKRPNILIFSNADGIFEDADAQSRIIKKFGENFFDNNFLSLKNSDKILHLEQIVNLYDDKNCNKIILKEKIKEKMSENKEKLLINQGNLNASKNFIEKLKISDKTIEKPKKSLKEYEKNRLELYSFKTRIEVLSKEIEEIEKKLEQIQVPEKIKLVEKSINVLSEDLENLIKQKLELDIILKDVENISIQIEKIDCNNFENIKQENVENEIKYYEAELENYTKINGRLEMINGEITNLQKKLSKEKGDSKTVADLIFKFKIYQEYNLLKSSLINPDLSFKKKCQTALFELSKISKFREKLLDYINLKGLDISCATPHYFKNMIDVFKIKNSILSTCPKCFSNLQIFNNEISLYEPLTNLELMGENLDYEEFTKVSEIYETLNLVLSVNQKFPKSETFYKNSIKKIEKDENLYAITNNSIGKIKEKFPDVESFQFDSLFNLEKTEHVLCCLESDEKIKINLDKLFNKKQCFGVDDIEEKICLIKKNLQNFLLFKQFIHLKNNLEKKKKIIEKYQTINFDVKIKECKLQINFKKNIVEKKLLSQQLEEKVFSLNKFPLNIEKEIYNVDRNITNWTIYNEQEKFKSIKNNIDLYNKENDELKLQETCLRIIKTSIADAESIALENLISNLNHTIQTFIDDFFERDLMSLKIEFFKQNSKSLNLINKVDVAILYKGNQIKINSLSSGEYARVNLAIYLAFQKIIPFKNNLLILDEKTANLDQELSSVIYSSIKQNFPNKTILVVAHQSVNGLFDYVLNL